MGVRPSFNGHMLILAFFHSFMPLDEAFCWVVVMVWTQIGSSIGRVFR